MRDSLGTHACEAATLPLALMRHGHKWQPRQAFWFVDNTVALHSFIKGAANDATLERCINLFYFVTYKYDISIWFEYVESKSNWADGISRDLCKDVFFAGHGIHIPRATIDIEWFLGSVLDVWHLVQDSI